MAILKSRLAKPHIVSVALFLLFLGLHFVTSNTIFWGLAGLMLGVQIGLGIARASYEKDDDTEEVTTTSRR